MGSALLGVVFCLNFGPFLFLLLFPCQVSFLYFFNYLFFTPNFQNSKRESVTFLLEEIGGKKHC